MAKHVILQEIPLPRMWPRTVKSAMLQVISLAQYTAALTRSWAVNSPIARMRLKAETERFRHRVGFLEEEIRIKDARMTRIDPYRRPHYSPTERLSILELRAASAWSVRQTADAFLVTSATITSWMKRLDEQGPGALLQLREPVNKFPDFVRYAVQRLKTLCPTLGKVKMAEVLCRAGLHLGSTTVGRILKESRRPTPQKASETTGRVVVAKAPNHVWHVDLTVVPIGTGFWTPWLRFAVPQRWPFAWWLAVIVDHNSRRAMGVTVFSKQPDSRAICGFVGRVVADANATPDHLICDKGSIFWCAFFKSWCKTKKIRPRYGAIGKHGSIAVVERFIRTMKDEATHRIAVPLRRTACYAELATYLAWYNEHRPHATLHGKTPDEVYFRLRAAKGRPRIEPRRRWPRRSPCAGTRTLIAGQPGDRFTLKVEFYEGRRYLPIVSLRRAA